MKKLLLVLILVVSCYSCKNKKVLIISNYDTPATISDGINIAFQLKNKPDIYSGNYNCTTSKTLSKYQIDSILSIIILPDGLVDTVYLFHQEYTNPSHYYAMSIADGYKNDSWGESVRQFKTLHFGEPKNYIDDIKKAYGKYNFGDSIPYVKSNLTDDGSYSISDYEQIGACSYYVAAYADKDFGIYEVYIRSTNPGSLQDIKDSQLRNLYDIVKQKHGMPTEIYEFSEYELQSGYIRYVFEWKVPGDRLIKMGILKFSDDSFGAVYSTRSGDIMHQQNQRDAILQQEALKIIKKEQQKAVDNF